VSGLIESGLPFFVAVLIVLVIELIAFTRKKNKK